MVIDCRATGMSFLVLYHVGHCFGRIDFWSLGTGISSWTGVGYMSGGVVCGVFMSVLHQLEHIVATQCLKGSSVREAVVHLITYHGACPGMIKVRHDLCY